MGGVGGEVALHGIPVLRELVLLAEQAGAEVGVLGVEPTAVVVLLQFPPLLVDL